MEQTETELTAEAARSAEKRRRGRSDFADFPSVPRHTVLMEEKDELNGLTRKIIESAIVVHRLLGPGLLESAYETAFCLDPPTAAL